MFQLPPQLTSLTSGIIDEFVELHLNIVNLPN
jgi:hypothetical protein